jgi:molybdopterin adenylyltransferase
MNSEKNNEFKAINISVLTISDSRSIEQDDSGEYLVSALKEQGHFLNDRRICKDNLYEIRAVLSQWILDEKVHGIITTGGTGITGKDGTPEAILPLLDKTIDGFGEMFRSLSYQNIKTSTLQSRAFAGVANGTFIFCLPGSPGACKDGWNFLIKDQLDSRTKPCNLVELMPRLNEE